MIKLVKSTFFNEETTKKEIAKFIKNSSQLSFGKECERFEKNFAKWQGRRHCVFLNSGSSANLAIIQTLLNLKKIKKGDKVGFSAVTWSTNVMPLVQLGLEPIPIDIELDTLNISSSIVEKAIKKYKIKMLFITNLLGFSGDLLEIKRLCEKNKVILIEDNCESLGSVYGGIKLGNFGEASTFSFYVGHHMSTIEGGAVCTDSDRIATMLRIVRAHGWDRNLSEKKQVRIRNKFQVNSTFYSRYTFYDIGYNLRPTEISGFIGNIQLKYLPEIIQKRIANYNEFSKSIYKHKEKYIEVRSNHMDINSNFAFPVICKSEEIRGELVKRCEGRIEIRPIVGGDMTMQPFFKRYSTRLSDNPNAYLVHKQGLYFGNNPELTRQEIAEIISVFTHF